ncbi:zinc finger, CCHC-type containing protein [Tanacetum coccineum]
MVCVIKHIPAFLNGELEEEVYMNQPLGFILLGNENKVCELVKSLYGLKHAPKKFDASGKGVIIFLYVDDMMIFGTDQVQVDLTKEFLSSRFSMKDMGEAAVILGIKIKHKSNGITISQSHYFEKVLKKFNYSDWTLVSTPLDTCEKLMHNRGLAVSQLKYSRVIGCLMYAMTCTRPNIAFAVGKLSRYTSNPGTQHWQAIQRVFLLGGGVISWASKKQTCITGSTMESEFVALAAAGKEAECVATLEKAYSQIYNGKSRHLGVRHSMIRKLITNGVGSVHTGIWGWSELTPMLPSESNPPEEVSSAVAKAFRVFNIRRKEMEETYHVTFNEADEVITQTSIEGIPLKSLEMMITYLISLYLMLFQLTTSLSLIIIPTAQDINSPDESPEFLIPDDHLVHNEPNESEQPKIHIDTFESQNITINDEPIRDVKPSPTIISPSDVIIHDTLAPQDRWSRDKHILLVNILGEPQAGVTTRSGVRDSEAALAHECLYVNFLFEIETKKVTEALEEEAWVISMQENLNQFERNNVWTLVSTPYGKTIIRTKWIFRNKMDENGVVIRNKARLVVQGYRQEEEIDY